MRNQLCLLLFPFILLLSGCVQNGISLPVGRPPNTDIRVQTFALRTANTCTNTFIPHFLEHTTIASTKEVGLYESNGSGVAINDLDNDGDLDIVLGNLGAENNIFWNEGGLLFQRQSLSHGASRAVNIVDVAGDGHLDIVFTQRFKKPIYWQNTGQDGASRFIQKELPDVNHPFYSLDWADLDQDGDLDFVAASYDTELRKAQGGIFDYRGGGIGVFVYERHNQTYRSDRLAQQADALAVALPDLNADGRFDILVGNDFDRPDYAWVQDGDGWLAAQPFAAMTENTMSFDIGDVNNDGLFDIFATDMKPYSDDAQTVATWEPLMAMMTHPTSPDDPQVLQNVLQMNAASGQFDNQATSRLVAATGWSWSSKFGDLDNDGLLDIYVVNGMIAKGLLDHLPNQALVEENQALRNGGQGYFVPVPEWGLGSTASGRGMSMADLDDDGDLDIVVNNLLSPAQVFENQLCGGTGLLVDLHWPSSQNPYGIGTQLVLHTDVGTFYRTIRASSGYLSGDPARAHVGLPANVSLERLEVHWPDGYQSDIAAPSLQPQTRLVIERQTMAD